MSTLARNTAAAQDIWWLQPSWAFGSAAGIVAIVAALIPADVFEQSWNTPKYIGPAVTFWIFASLAMFVAGAWIARRMTPQARAETPVQPWTERIPWKTAAVLFYASIVLCVIGYIAWAISAAMHGVTLQLLIGAMTGAKGATYQLRDTYLKTISGVTTMTQFGIAAIALGVPIGIARGWRKVAVPMAMVFLLGAIRAVVNSERLAIIELAVPLLVGIVSLRWASSRRRRLLAFLPVLGAVAIFVVFTACEYTRSWVTFYKGTEDVGLWEFGGNRLLGYYVTAENNSAYLWRELDVPLGAPFYTLSFLWRFPRVSDFVRDVFPSVTVAQPDQYMALLENGANPEFNNTGGVMLPLMDYGPGGGLLCWLLAGAVVQTLYCSFQRRGVVGLCLYPAIFIGLIEVPRILYWSDQRFFPAGCMLVLSSIVLSMEPRKEPSFHWAPRRRLS